MSDIVRTDSATPALLAGWLAGLPKNSQRGYSCSLRAFAAFTGSEDAASAADSLLSLGWREASLLVDRWKGAMLEAGLAPATVNVRLAAVRSFVKSARVGWVIDTDGVKQEKIRDTRGPGWEAYQRMLSAESDPVALALLRLLGDRGLRVSECLSLLGGGVDRANMRLEVLRKGHRERVWLTVAPETMAAVAPLVRGADDPIFWFKYGQAYALVRRAGARVGVRVTPHGLRHSAITRALDVTGGDVRSVRHFSGHASVETVLVYEDTRQDHAGEVARKVIG